MKVSVIGLGEIGCVTAACLARAGHRVLGVDVCQARVDMINAGVAPIVEPGLGDLLADVVGQGLLSATTDGPEAIRCSDVALICVGTPSLGDGRPDASAIERVGQMIGGALEGRDRTFTVVLRSTVLPGTTEGVLLPALLNGRPAAGHIKVAINPAFMRGGASLQDYEHPPLVLVGCDDLRTGSLVRDLYADVKAPFIETSVRTAELVKHASNAFHGLTVCFANEIGNLSDALGANGQDVMRIFAMVRKLNTAEAYMRPGFAFGGGRLPKDVRALIWAAKDRELDLPLLSAIPPSNDGQVRAAVDAVLRSGKTRIGVVGFASNPGADNMCDSPVATLIETLVRKGLDVRVLDGSGCFARFRGGNHPGDEADIADPATLLCDDVESLLEHAEVLVVGSTTREAVQAVDLVGPECAVVDLTRGAVYSEQHENRVGQPARPAAAALRRA